MGNVKKVITVLVLESVNWAVWEIAEEKGMIPETAQVSYWVLITGIFILMVIYWPEIWSLRKQPDKVGIAVPETKTWISYDFAIVIIRDHPAAKKHMMNMPLAEGLEDLKEIIDGKPSRYAHNKAVARAMLEDIIREYPGVKKDDRYSREILERALDQRMIM